MLESGRVLRVLFLSLVLAASLGVSPNVRADSIGQVEGVVSRVDGSIVSLLGGLVKIDATSAVITRRADGATLGIADILPGIEIQATIASTAADGTLVASSIRVGRLESVELAGAIQSIDAAGGAFKVAGQTVKTDASTRFSGQTSRGSVHGLADLQAGDFVEVTASASSAGLLALRVRAEHENEEPSASELVSFHGTVESQSASSWVISGKTVKITSTTRIEGSPNVGDAVEVEALKAADGTLTALKIEKTAAGDGEHVEFTGKVESKTAASWVIAGKTVKITAATKIQGDPAVGDTVRVVAEKAADGTLTALEIRKVSSSSGGGDIVEFEGKVESKSTSSWVISGKTVKITPATHIRGNPAVGDTVEVKAQKAADGTLTALVIEKKHGDGGGDGGDGDHSGDPRGGGHH